jgi:hypothetical protein
VCGRMDLSGGCIAFCQIVATMLQRPLFRRVKNESISFFIGGGRYRTAPLFFYGDERACWFVWGASNQLSSCRTTAESADYKCCHFRWWGYLIRITKPDVGVGACRCRRNVSAKGSCRRKEAYIGSHFRPEPICSFELERAAFNFPFKLCSFSSVCCDFEQVHFIYDFSWLVLFICNVWQPTARSASYSECQQIRRRDSWPLRHLWFSAVSPTVRNAGSWSRDGSRISE